MNDISNFKAKCLQSTVKAKDSNFIIQKKCVRKFKSIVLKLHKSNESVCLFDLTAICHTLFERQRVQKAANNKKYAKINDEQYFNVEFSIQLKI